MAFSTESSFLLFVIIEIRALDMVFKFKNFFDPPFLCVKTFLTPLFIRVKLRLPLIRIPGYVSYRRDRPNNQRGGGLCTYFNSQLNFTELTDLSEPEIESQWFLIRMERLPRAINSILLGTVYHPPQSDDHVLRMHIFKCLDSLLATYPNSAILVLGDFNQFKPGNLCNSFRLKKLVTKPTRESNILDQAFQLCHLTTMPSSCLLLVNLIIPVSYYNLF